MAINKKVLAAIVLSGTAMAGYVFYKGASMFSDTLMKTPVQRSKNRFQLKMPFKYIQKIIMERT